MASAASPHYIVLLAGLGCRLSRNKSLSSEYPCMLVSHIMGQLDDDDFLAFGRFGRGIRVSIHPAYKHRPTVIEYHLYVFDII